jgi:enterochelin esterase-like enzyme
MKRFAFVSWVIVFLILLLSCGTRASTDTVAVPTLTPKSDTSGNKVDPGEEIGGMLLTTGQDEGIPEIWEFCDPYVTGAGVTVRECQVPALQRILIGYGAPGNTLDELDSYWSTTSWELYLDDQPVNLTAFGTFDQVGDSNSVLRLWNVVLMNPAPGLHTLRSVSIENGELFDNTWNFTVASPATMEIPAGSETLPFTGMSDAFTTLEEFHSLMTSSVTNGDIDSFWETVSATGQMPLIFGDNVAVFLYRGQAENVECRGDFATPYIRQGETNIWAFIKLFEPDARVEYTIRLDSNQPIPDSLNPITETGGLGTNSVVQMPEYAIPLFTLPRDNIAHGVLGENLTITSQRLGYNVNYRVYTPVGYETLEHLPVIYATDGQDFINPEMGAMINVLDNLIADGRVGPIIAVFVDTRDPSTGVNRREEEFIGASIADCPFCDFVALELVPVIDTDYKTVASPNARAILGFSLGGNLTAHMGLKSADVFQQIAILSPYISTEWIFDIYQETSPLPIKIFLGHGTYDNQSASIRLRDILEAKGYPLLYVETHAGHSFGNVRGMLDDMLIYFFGK